MRDIEYRALLEEKLASMNEEEKNGLIERLFMALPNTKRNRFLSLLEKELKHPVDDKELLRLQKWISEVEQGVHYFRCHSFEDEDPWAMDSGWAYEDHCGIATRLEQGLTLARRLFLQRFYDEALKVYNALTHLPFHAVNDELEETVLLNLEDIIFEGLVEIHYEEVLLHQLSSAYHALQSTERLETLYQMLSRPSCNGIRIEEIFMLDMPSTVGKASFLEEWQAFLRKIPDHRAEKLLSEAAMMQGGIQHLVELARKDWPRYPGLYLDACSHLWVKGRDDECLALGQEAMGTLPVHWTLRASICEIGASAALRLQDEDMVSVFWESAFYSHSSLVNYLRLFRLPHGASMAAKAAHHAMTLPLRAVRAYPTEPKSLEINTITRVEKEVLRFFSGDYTAAQLLCQADGNALGWSTSLKGILVPLFLLALRKGDTFTKAQDLLWRQILWRLDLEQEQKEYLLHGFFLWKESLGFSPQQVEQYRDWMRQEVERRVDAVVGGGYRKSYSKAALLVQSFGEMLESHGVQDGIRHTVEAFCKRYPRKRAFRSAFQEFETPH